MDKMKERILVVDDDSLVREWLAGMLAEQGFAALQAGDGSEALRLTDSDDLDLILLDFDLGPGIDGLAVLRAVKQRKPRLPVVMISGVAKGGQGAEAIKLGAYDFLDKGPELQPERVILTVRNALERGALQRQVANLQTETTERYRMVGNSPAMQKVFETISLAAPSSGSVLILGERGTGKELAAWAIHHQSLVAEGPYVRINCAAIPRELIESELFGYEKGAFSGAGASKPGRLELADNGTAFLDEIGDMDSSVQAKLLRFLQDGELARVGATRTRKVQVRIVAATNKDLQVEMKERRFREDLYDRLNVISLRIPPLREHREDIPLLAEYFLTGQCRKQGTVQKSFAEDAMKLLSTQPWPGNVRELEHAVERITIMLPQLVVLAARDIEPWLAAERDGGRETGDRRTPPVSGPRSPVFDLSSLDAATDDFQRKYILDALSACNWNVAEVARRLGKDQATIHRDLSRWGIRRPATAD
jgi:two-component system nitrogen regulation response regulator NtrX